LQDIASVSYSAPNESRWKIQGLAINQPDWTLTSYVRSSCGVKCFSDTSVSAHHYLIAAITGDHFGPTKINFSAQSIRICADVGNVPVDPNARPAIGNKAVQTPGSRPGKCCTTRANYSSNCNGPTGQRVNETETIQECYPINNSTRENPFSLYFLCNVLGVLGKSGKQLGEFGWIHEIACPQEDQLYVAEILNWRVQKLILEPDH
jgi:hypothetical protein